MDTNNDWMLLDSYTARKPKVELVPNARALHFAYTTLKAQHRELGMKYDEALLTVKANAPTVKAADMRASASRRYCAEHGVKSVSKADLDQYIKGDIL